MSAGSPLPQTVRHHVGTCIADFRVSADDGPLASPDRILAALRQEILPALDELLHSNQLADADAQVGALQIDLGEWPKDPDWAALRAVFRDQLESALAPYLRWPSVGGSGQISGRTAQIYSQEQKEDRDSFSTSSTADYSASNLTDAQGTANRPELKAADLLDMVNGTTEQLLARLDRTLADSSEAAGAVFAGLFGDRIIRDALSANHGAETLAQIRAMMIVARHVPNTQTPPPSAPEYYRDPVSGETPALSLLNRLFTDVEGPMERAAQLALNRALQLPFFGDPAAADTEVGTEKERARGASNQPHHIPIAAVSKALISMTEAALSRLDKLLIEQSSRSRTAVGPLHQGPDTSEPQTAPAPSNDTARRELSQRIAKALTLAGHAQAEARLLADAISARHSAASADAAKIGAGSDFEVEDHRDDQQFTVQNLEGDPPPKVDMSAHRSFTLPTDALDPDAATRTFDNWTSWLINPATTAAQVRKDWQTNAFELSTALASMSINDLSNLIAKLGPQNALTFSDAVKKLRQTTTYPRRALAHLLRELLNGQPLDITAALQAGTQPDQGSGTNNAMPASSAGHEAAGLEDFSNSRRPSMGELASSQGLGAPHWSELLLAMGHDPATITAAFNPNASYSMSRVHSAQAPMTNKLKSNPDTTKIFAGKTATETEHSSKTHHQTATQTDADQRFPTKSSFDRGAQSVDPAEVNYPNHDTDSVVGAATALADMQPALEAIVHASASRPGADVLRDWRAALNLIWSALPPSVQLSDPMATPIETGIALKVADADPSAETGPPDASTALAERDPRYWKILLKLSLAPHRPDDNLSAFLDDALHEFLPGPHQRKTELRYLIARLSYTVGAPLPALRVQTLEALRDIANRQPAPPTQPDGSGRAVSLPSVGLEALAEPSGMPHFLTARAGLVLFHPYIKMLFERLDLLDDNRSIRPESLIKACAALRLLSDETTHDDRPTDPLEKVLLGLPQNWKHPGTALTETPDTAVVDGLLSAVIERWGALGQTSPDGLREAFVCRGGTLSHNENGIHLSVDPGPFDMLLDKLPWGIGTVALPWMGLPCYVDWR